MFIRFNVANFLSFNTVQEFSMIGGKMSSKMNHIYSDDKIKLLKFAALFGANASGKSNLILAIDFARETIISKLPKNHGMKYFKGIESNKEKKSYFEFEVKIGDNYYSYGFEVILAEGKITSEWLIELVPNKSEKIVFVRDIEKGTFTVDQYFKNKSLINKLSVYTDDIKTDGSILLLRLMNQNKDNFYNDYEEAQIFNDMFRWIKVKLDINYPDKPLSNYAYFMTDDSMDEISRIISAFGTGITKFNIVDVQMDSISAHIPKTIMQDIVLELEQNNAHMKEQDKNTKIILRNKRKDFIIFEMDDTGKIRSRSIQFNHGNENIFYSLSEESDGTLRILDLIEILLNTQKDKVYIIDEIDRCLHPQLTYKFIEAFLQLAIKRDTQLIVTTHESRLLDFNLLRRDEVWFANKNSEGESKLYSLEEYNSRFDHKIDKAYLDGRYGGIPLFKTIFPVKED